MNPDDQPHDIVVLGYQPDADVLDSIVGALKNTGLSVWFDAHDAVGDNLPNDRIRAQIARSKLTLICVSAQSVDRPWFVAEHEFCAALYKQDLPRHLLQVRIEPFEQSKLPDPVRREDVPYFRLQPTAEGNLSDLVGEVFKRLQRPTPLVVTGVVVAMTQAEWQQLAQTQLPEPLVALCNAMGLPNCGDDLGRRYGNHPHDLVPFADGTSIVNCIDQALSEVNPRRIAMHARPLLMRWLDADLRAEKPASKKAWERDDSLLVVDAVSVFHQGPRALLDAIPDHQEPHRCALLWVPPYTMHTGSQAHLVRATMQSVGRLDNPFRRWCDGDDRGDGVNLCFDLSTRPGLDTWLCRTFARAGSQRVDPARVALLRQGAKPRSMDDIMGGDA